MSGFTFLPAASHSLIDLSAYEQKFFSYWSNKAYAYTDAKLSALNYSSAATLFTSPCFLRNQTSSSCRCFSSSRSCCSANCNSQFLTFQNWANSFSSCLSLARSFCFLSTYKALDLSIACFISNLRRCCSSYRRLALSSASATYLLRTCSWLSLRARSYPT